MALDLSRPLSAGIAPISEAAENRLLARSTSIYLDLLRLTAALAVFAGHANGFFFNLPHVGIIFGHAREAVAVFFVLSGFVIRFVVVEKEHNWRAYVTARISRIYPVALIAIGLIFALDWIGTSINPEYYASLYFYKPETPAALLSYLTFTSQIWFSHVVFGSGEPYWSLSFEVWYYVFFGLLIFLPRNLTVAGLAAWAAVCGPKIVIYLPLWLLGAATYELLRRRARLNAKAALVGFVATPILYIAIWHYVGKLAGGMYESYAFGQETMNFLYFMLIGLVVVANIILFEHATFKLRVFPERLARAIRWAAGASFTLYLVHQPLFALLSATMPRARTSTLVGVGCCALTLCATLLLAEIGERRKKIYASVVRSFIC